MRTISNLLIVLSASVIASLALAGETPEQQKAKREALEQILDQVSAQNGRKAATTEPTEATEEAPKVEIKKPTTALQKYIERDFVGSKEQNKKISELYSAEEANQAIFTIEGLLLNKEAEP